MSGTPSVRFPFEPSHPDTLAVYCSDGRFTDAVESLLHRFGHARLDTLTLPGGPALLELTSAKLESVDTLRAAASFLIDAHGIKHVTLLAHHGCGYYAHRFPHDSPDYRVRRQVADLRAAGRWIVSSHPGIALRLFYAQVRDGGVAFEAVEPAP